MSEGIPEGWTTNRLGDSAANVTTKYLPNHSDNFRYIGLEHVTPESHILTNWGYSKDVISTKSRFTEGDTLFGKLRPYLKKVAYANFDGVCSTDILVIRAKSPMHPEFLFRVLSSEEAIRHSMESSAGNVMPRTSWKDMADLQFTAPPRTEQQKIASILTSVDNVIEKTEAQIGKLQDLKRGMLAELLTRGVGHKEFKDSPVGRIPRKWDVVRLRDFISSIHSGWSPVCDPRKRTGDEWGILKTTAVVWSGYDPNENKVLASHYECVENAVVQPNDVLITRKGPRERVGVCVFVPDTPSRLMIPDTVFRMILAEDSKLEPEFTALAIGSDSVQLDWDRKKVGLAEAQVNINHQIINGTLIALPNLVEQQTICDVIRDSQRTIDRKKEKLRSILRLKKALMQDLLTGKVRVKVN